MNNRYMKIFAFGLAAALVMAGLKICDYYFFSYQLTLDAYLGIVALLFLVIGGAIGYSLLSGARYDKPNLRNERSAFPGAKNKAQLTDRESEVLHLIALGYSNQQIADELFISMNTVKTHIKNIYSKMGVQRRTQAVAEAKRLQILD